MDGTHTSLLSPGKWIFLCCPELLCGQGRLLRRYNIDFKIKTNIGVTFAQCAIRVGNIDCLRLLTEEAQMRWEDRNSDGDTVFMEAVKCQDREVIRVLLACSAVDINAASERTHSDPSSNFPIIWCLRNKKYQIAIYIINVQIYKY